MRLSFIIISLSFLLNVPTCQVNKPAESQANNSDSTSLTFRMLYDTIEVRDIHPREAHLIDSTFTRLYKQGRFNGAVLVADKGQVYYKKVFGYSDLAIKDSLSFNSAFQLASVSKMYTALAIMQLHEKGKLEYDHDVRYFLPEFPYDGITIRHLLTHHSGLSNYMALTDKYWNKKEQLTNEDVYLLFAKYKPKLYFRPGKRFNYSNTNYAFLALIVQKLSHMPFDEYVTKYIFEPAGMTSSFVYKPGTTRPNEVPGFNRTRRGYTRIPDDYINGVWGDKGIYSTVEDMYRFDMALKYEILISRGSVEEAFTPSNYLTKKPSTIKNYGFGWRIRFWEEHKVVYHFGWWRGFRTGFLKNMNSDKTLIILNNTNSFPDHNLVWGILGVFDQEPES